MAPLIGRTPLDDEFLRSILSYFSALKRVFDFKGVSSRREFWGFQFFQALVLLASLGLKSGGYLFISTILEWLVWASLISSLSLTIRRLRDVGKSWWWVLPCFVWGLNLVVWVLFLLKPSPGWKPAKDEEYWWNPWSWKDGFFFIWWS